MSAFERSIMSAAEMADYQRCLDRVTVLCEANPAPGSAESNELVYLATAVELYEKLKFPISTSASNEGSATTSPWPPFELSVEDQRNSLVAALRLLRRWRRHEYPSDKNEDYRLFSETGTFCMLAETGLGMDPKNPPRKAPRPDAEALAAVPTLKEGKALVLYFHTDADRDKFVDLVQHAVNFKKVVKL